MKYDMHTFFYNTSLNSASDFQQNKEKGGVFIIDVSRLVRRQKSLRCLMGMKSN